MEDPTDSTLNLELAQIELGYYSGQTTTNKGNRSRTLLIDIVNPQPRSTAPFYSRVQSTKQQPVGAAQSPRIRRRFNRKVQG